MPFEKGDMRINRTGRKPGALNRSTEQMKLTIARATNQALDTIGADLAEIRKKDPENWEEELEDYNEKYFNYILNNPLSKEAIIHDLVKVHLKINGEFHIDYDYYADSLYLKYYNLVIKTMSKYYGYEE